MNFTSTFEALSRFYLDVFAREDLAVGIGSCFYGFLNKAAILVYNLQLPYSGKVLRGESLVNWLVTSIWQKKIWQINRLANRLLIVSTNLDGFSLANHDSLPNFPPLPPNFPAITVPYENKILNGHRPG